MPCLDVSLALEDLPELLGEFEHLGSANLIANASVESEGYVVANGSADIESSSVIIGLGVHAYHGGEALILARDTISSRGLRQGADGAIPINFQKDFY